MTEPAEDEPMRAFVGARYMSDRDVWTLQTWLPGDPPEGFGYGYPTQESAERNGREFQHSGRDAVRWQVVSPGGAIVASWTAS